MKVEMYEITHPQNTKAKDILPSNSSPTVTDLLLNNDHIHNHGHDEGQPSNLNNLMKFPIDSDLMNKCLLEKSNNYLTFEQLLKQETSETHLLKLNNNLEIARRFVDKLSDIQCYANLIMEVEYIKSLLFNEHQLMALKMIKLINIDQLSPKFRESLVFSIIEKELDDSQQCEILNYFIHNINIHNVSAKDKLLLSIIDPFYRKLIEKYVNDKEYLNNLKLTI